MSALAQSIKRQTEGQALNLPFFFFRIMAISQGFNLPPTGRIGKVTTGHRSGNYNLRVIPDVDDNAERSEKQKAENSKFGFLSDFINSNLEFFKLGFPKAYQPLNTAIKVNRENVIKTSTSYRIDFPKFNFSKGKLALVSISNLRLYRDGNQYKVRIDFLNDYAGGKSSDKIISITRIVERNIIIFNPLDITSAFTRGNRRVNTPNLSSYRHRTAQISIFLFNGKEASNTIYCGEKILEW